MPKKSGAKGTKRKRSSSASSSGRGKKKQRRADVTLTIGTQKYSGTSSGQYGHAEMSALRKFIVATEKAGGNAAEEIMAVRTKKVRCLKQPVCGSCTMVLKAIEFKRSSAKTKWSNEPSGGVSWGANLKVEQLMKDLGKSRVYNQAKKAGAK